MGKRIHGLVDERTCACRKLNPGIIGAAFRLGECARCTSPSRSHRRLRVTVCAKRANRRVSPAVRALRSDVMRRAASRGRKVAMRRGASRCLP